MTVTVSVDATWRIARCELYAPHAENGMINAYGEVLLQEPATPSEGAEIMRFRASPMAPAPKEGEPVIYGTVAGAHITRGIPEVMKETVEMDGAEVSFSTVMAQLAAFIEKWRVEDANAPPPEPMMAPPPMPEPMPPPEFEPPESEE